MNKKKMIVSQKVIAVALPVLILIFTAICFWKISATHYSYSPETRVDTAEALMQTQKSQSSRVMPYTLETNVVISDAIVRGKVISEGSPVMRGGTAFAYEYDVEVTEVLYGELSSSKILLRCFSYMNLPHQNDDLILFLMVLRQGCITANGDTGFFAVMPDNTLYAFSNMDFAADFDGKQPEELYIAIDDIIQKLSETGEGYLNGENYLSYEGALLQRAIEGTQPLRMAESDEGEELSDLDTSFEEATEESLAEQPVE